MAGDGLQRGPVRPPPWARPAAASRDVPGAGKGRAPLKNHVLGYGGSMHSLDIARADLRRSGIFSPRPCREPYVGFFGLLSPGPRICDVGASSPARGRHRAKSMHSLDIAAAGDPHGRRCPLAPGPGPYVGFLGLLSPGASVVYFYTIKMSRKTTRISLRSQQYRPPKVGTLPSLSCTVSVRNQRQGAAQSPVNLNFIS